MASLSNTAQQAQKGSQTTTTTATPKPNRRVAFDTNTAAAAIQTATQPQASLTPASATSSNASRSPFSPSVDEIDIFGGNASPQHIDFSHADTGPHAEASAAEEPQPEVASTSSKQTNTSSLINFDLTRISQLTNGSSIGNMYTLDEPLLQFEEGAIYKAHLKQLPAKSFLIKTATNEEETTKLKTEFDALTALKETEHAHLFPRPVTIKEDGTSCITVTEFVQGHTLLAAITDLDASALSESQKLETKEAYLLNIIRIADTLRGLQLVSGSLTATNLMVTPDGSVLLTDLKNIASDDDITASYTISDDAYKSPEMSQGRPDVKIDIFAISIIVDILLNGKQPEQGSFFDRVKQAALKPSDSRSITTLRQLVTDYPSTKSTTTTDL